MRIRRTKPGEWAQYTFVTDYPVLKKFRKLVKVRGDSASRILTNAMQAYVNRVERQESDQKEEKKEGE